MLKDGLQLLNKPLNV